LLAGQVELCLIEDEPRLNLMQHIQKPILKEQEPAAKKRGQTKHSYFIICENQFFGEYEMLLRLKLREMQAICLTDVQAYFISSEVRANF